MRRHFYIITVLFFAGFLPVLQAADGVSNLAPIFSCTDGKVTLTYDLDTSDPTDLVLYYSHNTVDWLLAKTVTGDLVAQNTGTGKTITWDCFADNVRLGKFYFKIEAPPPTCRVRSTLTQPPYNGWLTFLCYNLGANPDMTIEEQMAYVPVDEYDATVYGDLYQWGRVADGHHKRSPDPLSVAGPLSGADLDAVTGQVIGVHFGKFVTNGASSPYDWRTPQLNTLWYNNGKTTNDPCPVGWRVPTSTEWQSIVNGNMNAVMNIPATGQFMTSGNYWKWNGNGWTASPDGVASGTVTLFLPAAMSRWYTGLVNNNNGRYWSNTVSSVKNTLVLSVGFTHNGDDISMGNSFYRGAGFSVRCVAE